MKERTLGSIIRKIFQRKPKHKHNWFYETPDHRICLSKDCDALQERLGSFGMWENIALFDQWFKHASEWKTYLKHKETQKVLSEKMKEEYLGGIQNSS